jgi:PLP dependent protein
MGKRAGLEQSSHWYNWFMEEDLVEKIQQRYQSVFNQIEEATIRSGREPGKVKLVVVTKSQPLEVVKAAIVAGASILGENYIEQAVAKITALPEAAVEWHMIGHVQSRKAELIPGRFSMLHSLDSLKLAARLSRFCVEAGRTLPALLEVNVSGEESKFGFPAWDEKQWVGLVPQFEQIMGFPQVVLKGLMTMPPYFVDPERTRPYFQRLRHFQAYLIEHIPQVDWAELSMGTSGDFVNAVEEGATYVRVGQAILGARPVDRN